MNAVKLIATSAFGLESVVAGELKQLGYKDLQVENGRVCFQADPGAIPRCNLWLRTADRLLLVMGEFQALSFSELFDKTKQLPWADWIPVDAQFPVEGKSIQSQLFSVPDCQAIVKKAIVEQMKSKYKINWFKENGPRYKIQVALLKNRATLTIDTSGAGLHKRGYRELTGEAPLKETLAAAMIILSRWKPDRALIDPLCGSGTIPIEAGLIGRNIAPGLNRNFISETWRQISTKLWAQARQEARDLLQPLQPLGIQGFDIDPQALDLARHHLVKAGLKSGITFQKQNVSDMRSKYKYGYLITNPPYGERLSEKPEVETLYRSLGQVCKNLDTWNFYVITSHPQFEQFFGRRSDKKRKLYNGRIQCTYYQFFGPKPASLTGPFAMPGPQA